MSSGETQEEVRRGQLARIAPARSFPTWEHLKQLRKARVVRSMHIWLIVVPILAKLSTKLSTAPAIKVLDATFALNYELPFSWQLFYFSALTFSVGNLIFVLRCPSIIVDHSNPAEFHATGKGWDQLVHYGWNAGLSSEEMQNHLQKTRAEVQAVDKRYNRLFWIFYDHANKQRRASLWSGALAFVVGLALIGIVLGQNLLAVLRISLPPGW